MLYGRRTAMWLNSFCGWQLMLAVLISFPTFAVAEKVLARVNDLDIALCSQHVITSKELVLNASITYTIKARKFCIVRLPSGFTLRSDSKSMPAIVSCSHPAAQSRTESTTGFGFINTNNLTIKNIVFEKCGAILSRYVLQSVSSSDPYYSPHHAAVLLFSHCWNITLINITFTHYHGFAVVAGNVFGISTFEALNVKAMSSFVEQQHTDGTGSGVLIHYFDHHEFPGTASHQMVITESRFEHNHDYSPVKCPYEVYHCAKSENRNKLSSNSKTKLVYAASLTLIYSHKWYNTSVTINKCSFHQNMGSLASSIFVMHINSFSQASTVISATNFSNNINTLACRGNAVSFYSCPKKQKASIMPNASLIINDSVFDSNGYRNSASLEQDQGAIYIGAKSCHQAKVQVILENVIFQENFAMYAGSCVYASADCDDVCENDKNNRSGVTIQMVSILATNNVLQNLTKKEHTTGIFQFYSISEVRIVGTESNPSTFTNNSGTVLNMMNTNLYLMGYQQYQYNHAPFGAAITLFEVSHLFLQQGLRAHFESNTAQLSGGAIYSSTDDTQCVFQVRELDCTAPEKLNITMFFSSNQANIAGNSIFANYMYKCYTPGCHRYTCRLMETIYENIFRFDHNPDNGLNNYSSDAIYLKPCTTNQSPTSPNAKITTYPGKTEQIQLVSLDASNKSVHATVFISPMNIDKNGQLSNIDWWFDYDNQQQVFSENSQSCTTLNITIHISSTCQSSNSLCHGHLIFTLYRSPVAYKLPVTLKDCPIGFNLSHSDGVCKCADVITEINNNISAGIKCNITDQTINKPNQLTLWCGEVKSTFGVSLMCPKGYCTQGSVINLSEDNTNHSNCIENRTGTLCGSCVGGYSAVLGTTECKNCSNSDMLLLIKIPAFALAGLLLVSLLFALRLTLTTGTINGLIFYANAAYAGILDAPHNLKNIKFSQHISVFISLLNLDLGFSFCFFDGMTQVWKAGLNLVFPVYLLTIVGLLILVSRRFVWVSNVISKSSTQVLVTIVHISFSKLVLALMDVYTHSFIHTSDRTFVVWYWDGDVDYTARNHVILMCVTALVAGSFTIPYVTLLLGAKPLMKTAFINKHFRPVVESIHAPFKDRYQYWFVVRLFVLVTIFIIYIFLREKDYTLMRLMTGTILITFLIIQAYLKPFKNKFINMLDCWIMLNLCVSYVTPWNSFDDKQSLVSIITITTCHCLVSITFMAVVVYHLLWVLGCFKTLANIRSSVETLFARPLSVQYREEPEINTQIHAYNNRSDSFSQLRESALSL